MKHATSQPTRRSSVVHDNNLQRKVRQEQTSNSSKKDTVRCSIHELCWMKSPQTRVWLVSLCSVYLTNVVYAYVSGGASSRYSNSDKISIKRTDVIGVVGFEGLVRVEEEEWRRALSTYCREQNTLPDILRAPVPSLYSMITTLARGDRNGLWFIEER